MVAFDGPPKLQFPILNKSAKRRIFGIAEVSSNRRGSYDLIIWNMFSLRLHIIRVSRFAYFLVNDVCG